MKKSLIAMAALAVVGAASAQSSVTLYGIIDVGYGSHSTTSRDGTAFTKTAGVMDGSRAGSRLGFRGTEDLGKGLKLNFVIEQGINITSPEAFNQRVASGGHQIVGVGNANAGTGAATYSTGNSRQAFVGLSSDSFGEVRIGYQYTNSYDLVAFSGYSLTEFQGGNYQNQTHANGSRANAITYIAPKISGVTLKAQLGSGTGRGTVESDVVTGGNGFTKNNNAYLSLMAAYAQGPVSAAYAYSKAGVTQANAIGAIVISPFGVNGTAATAAIVNTATRNNVSHNLGASYNFGVAVVSATLGRLSDGGAATTTDPTTTNARQLSVKVPVGAFELMASMGSAKGIRASVTTLDSKGQMLGVNYVLSKRTNMYALMGSQRNEFVVAAATAGFRDNKTVVGLQHSF